MTKVKTTIAYIILIIASFLSAFPLYYMICGATNSSIDIVRGKLFPGIYLMENYQSLIANQNLGRAMFNSFRNAIVITVIACLLYTSDAADEKRGVDLGGSRISKKKKKKNVKT